jgi:RNA polymerase sigma-70 factor (ECF subfamily)
MEREWVRAAQSGDEAAFGRLVGLHQKALFAFLLGMTRRTDAADDLAQEAFLKAWKALPGFKGESAFRTWLFQIALNLARSWGRRPKWLTFFSGGGEDTPSGDWLEARPDTGSDADPGRAADRDDLRRRIDAGLARLSSREREAFVLKYVEDMKISEVAAVMGAAEGTVKSHLFHAAQKMRAYLERTDGAR